MALRRLSIASSTVDMFWALKSSQTFLCSGLFRFKLWSGCMTQFRPRFHAWLIAHRPVDDADRVALCLREFLPVQVEISDALGAVHPRIGRRIGLQNPLIVLDCLLCGPLVVFRIYARNILTCQRGCQIHLGSGLAGAKFNRFAEVFLSVFDS